MLEEFTVSIDCPWCGHGHIYATDRVKRRVSVMCPNCSNLFVSDLYTMRGYKPKDVPGKSRPMILKLPCPCPGCRGFAEADGYEDVLLSIKCGKKHKNTQQGYSRYYQASLMTEETWYAPPIRKQGRNK